jgi:hypothetical protein
VYRVSFLSARYSDPTARYPAARAIATFAERIRPESRPIADEQTRALQDFIVRRSSQV